MNNFFFYFRNGKCHWQNNPTNTSTIIARISYITAIWCVMLAQRHTQQIEEMKRKYLTSEIFCI